MIFCIYSVTFNQMFKMLYKIGLYDPFYLMLLTLKYFSMYKITTSQISIEFGYIIVYINYNNGYPNSQSLLSTFFNPLLDAIKLWSKYQIKPLIKKTSVNVLTNVDLMQQTSLHPYYWYIVMPQLNKTSIYCMCVQNINCKTKMCVVWKLYTVIIMAFL